MNEIYFEKTDCVRGASMGMYNALASGISKVKDVTVMLSNYTFAVPGSRFTIK